MSNSNFSYLLEDFDLANYGNTSQEKLEKIVSDIKDIYDFFGAELLISYHSLYLALKRYSKDIYGLQRIKDKLSSSFSGNTLDDIINYIKNNAGLTIETLDPHLNKKLAYLTYHLICQKPFFVNKLNRSYYNNNKCYYLVGSNFNEVITIVILLQILEEYQASIDLKDKEYFVHCLRNRNLSRSSLELIFESLLIKK